MKKFFGLTLLLMLPSAAGAADGPPDAVKSLELAHKLAGCVFKSAPAEAQALLVLDQQSPDYQPRLLAILNGPAAGCKKKAKGLEIGLGSLGGMIAEASLRSRFDPDVPARLLAQDPNRQPVPARNLVEEIALCTVARAPEASSRLLATRPAREREAKAIELIRPTVSACTKPGVRFNAGGPALRSVLALAAWRLVYAPKRSAQ